MPAHAPSTSRARLLNPSPLERLHMAAKAGDLAAIDEALAAGGDPNGINNANGISPLIRAIRHDQGGTVQHLLAHGALPDVPVVGPPIDQALHVAARQNDLLTVQRLVHAGAALESRNKTRMTPLIVACAHGRDQVADWLLTQGANVHAMADLGKTSLHQALAQRSVATVRVLMRHGADPRFRPPTHAGAESPKDWAQRKGLTDLVALMDGIVLRAELNQALADTPSVARARVRL